MNVQDLARELYETWMDAREEVADWPALAAADKEAWIEVARAAINQFK